MSKKNLIFRDTLKLITPKLYADTANVVGDIFAVQSNNGRVGLRTVIRATHSGYLLNSRVYPGVFMEKSASSWVSKKYGGTASYEKPVLINHEDHDVKSIIGRVKGYQFTPLKQGDEFKNDFKRPSSGTDHGSGFIKLDSIITDQDAIQKILDGTYDTVSTGQRPSEARCNICGHDWMKRATDSTCDHIPGSIYQIDKLEIQCYLITGMLDYKEVSYVPVPAQPNARTLQANIESLQSFASKDAEGEFYYNAYGDSVCNNLQLYDTDGNILDLVLKDGEKDVISDAAIKLINKAAVFFPADNEMKNKKTTNAADKVLDSWIGEAINASTEQETKEETTSLDTTTETVVKSEETKETNKDTEVNTVKQDDAKIVELNKTIETLTATNTALTTKVTELESRDGEKAEMINTLTRQATGLRTENVKSSARTLAIIRSITGQGKDALKSDKDFNAYVEQLSKRSIESLNDAIIDSLPELQETLSSRVNPKSIAKVENPVLQHTDTPAKKDGVNDGEKKALTDKDSYLDDEGL